MTPWVLRIIVANVVMFFLQQTAPIINQMFVLVPALGLVRPWSFVTYMFLHGGLGNFRNCSAFFWAPARVALGPLLSRPLFTRH